MKKILIVFGTRPEAIKLAPLIHEFRNHPEEIELKICVTGQQRELLDQVLRFFSIVPDFDLEIMRKDQDLFDISLRALARLEEVMTSYQPESCIVQGDTTTAFIAALASFYLKIPLIHLEAGLRSGNKYHPYPEEMNRKMISVLADIHFAPTERAMQNLLAEQAQGQIFMVGNTVVDALHMTIQLIEKQHERNYLEYFDYIDFSKKIILVTGHRRESFGKPLVEICNAILEIAANNDVEIVYPVHLNPNVRIPAERLLGSRSNIHLVPPLPYPEMVWIMSRCHLIISDSGGIQEEAPTFGKPVIVTREVTERMEGVEYGLAYLAGSDKNKIVSGAASFIDNQRDVPHKEKQNPYGDGKASERITQIILGQNT